MDLITADLQLTDNPRDEYRHSFMRKLPKVAAGADRVIILGDLTEEKDRHPAALVNRVVRYFFELAKQAEVIFLQGNHDYADAANPFFKFLSRLHKVRYISGPTVIGDDLFLPHTIDHVRDWKGIRFSDFDRIFAHNTFTGARAANGTALKGIPVSVFPSDVMVIAGDVHTPQNVGPVTYVGAPYLVDFGDNYHPRVMLMRGRDYRSLTIDGPQKWLIEIEWPVFPRAHAANRGDIVKIRVAIKTSHMAKWPELRKKVADWAEDKGYNVFMIQPVVAYQPGAPVNDRSVPPHRLDDDKLLKTYASQCDVDSQTLKVGLKLLKAAK